jgi:phosphoribosylamine--glycine ligase
MKILIVGGGGREHALAWKAARSSRLKRVYVAPGNAGTAAEPKCENVTIGAEDITALIAFAHEEDIGLTLVGPEAPLVAGIVDEFTAAGLACFGPTRAAARLEGSKTFAKDFCSRHGIPTAAYRGFTQAEAAKRYARELPLPIVIKASGLAAGKGVVIAQTAEDADKAIEAMLSGSAFGAAGREIVIEEFLAGEEASFMVLASGSQYIPLATSQDHKRIGEGDTGANTGGMGAYSPAPVVTEALGERIEREIIRPTLAGMIAEGAPYTGFLYAGLMIGNDGTPRLIEFNCRLGDPETQPVLMRLDSDLIALLQAALGGELEGVSLAWSEQTALGIVLASAGYPAGSHKGDVIRGLECATGKDVKIFHGGTAESNGDIVTAGGRVLCVTALGDDVAAAQDRAYATIAKTRFDGMQYRRDIGAKAASREYSTD